jgi:hypothetical protein
MRSVYLFVGVFGALVVGAVLAQSVHGTTISMNNNNKPAINTIAGIVGSTLPIAMKDNATTASHSVASAGNTTAASNNVTNNNVTAASGNNGHIYRGGAAAGSGGE